jgi:hypothetical protein
MSDRYKKFLNDFMDLLKCDYNCFGHTNHINLSFNFKISLTIIIV